MRKQAALPPGPSGAMLGMMTGRRANSGQYGFGAGSLGSFLLVLFIVVLAFWYYRSTVAPVEPGNVPLLPAEILMQELQDSPVPVLVFFYHSPTGIAARTYFSVLDDLAQRFGSKVRFRRYLYPPDEGTAARFFPEFRHYDSVLAVFRNAQEIKRSPVVIFSDPVAQRGFVFVLIKDLLGIDKAMALSSPHPSSALMISAGDFKPAVEEAAGYAVVLFTSPHCPAARRFQPDFEKVAQENSYLADYYVMDVSVRANSDIQAAYAGKSTPTTVLFYRGEVKGKFSGTFSDSRANEAVLLGLLVPYL